MSKIDIAREEAINKAIDFIKRCPYKGTAIKIELEGQLNRYRRRQCSMCGGTGMFECIECPDNSDCETCEGRGRADCQSCNGEGTHPAARFEMQDEACEDYILDHVSAEARNALVYRRLYNDGSVDTEFTFTLKLEDVRYAVEFIKAFKALSEHLGGGLSTAGAGMHIAILNSPSGNYPVGNSLDSRRANNFKYSMTKLLPALYFLASPTHASRRLGYRKPMISLTSKYGAISGRMKCFEYRIFETCYERPEAILDNLCIIANTLKYYHYRKITHPFFGKIGKVDFNDFGQGLNRFFENESAYRALMSGVTLLKPSYKTITDLRKERNFKLTLTKIKQKDTLREKMWEHEYRTKRAKVESTQTRLIRQAEQRYLQEGAYTRREVSKPQYIKHYLAGYGIDYPIGTLKQFIKDKKSAMTQGAYASIEV